MTTPPGFEGLASEDAATIDAIVERIRGGPARGPGWTICVSFERHERRYQLNSYEQVEQFSALAENLGYGITLEPRVGCDFLFVKRPHLGAQMH